VTPEAWAGWIAAAFAALGLLGAVAAYFTRQGSDRRAIQTNAEGIAQLRSAIAREREDRKDAITEARAAADQIAAAVKESLDRRFDEVDKALRDLREDVRASNDQHAKLLVELGRSQAQRDEAARRIDRLENLLIKAP
jgi:chromosome segregation ATPase